MQDRIPLYPGRVKMTPVAGQANTYDMVRADDPTQVGTPLNKATLLQDATAALYGLTSSAVPDDVFAAIGKYKQYWWRRRVNIAEGGYVEHQTVVSGNIYINEDTPTTAMKVYITYSSAITVNTATGNITFYNPQTMTGSTARQDPSLLLGKYAKNLSTSKNTLYFISDNATYYETEEGDPSVNRYTSGVYEVTSVYNEDVYIGDWQYIQSINRNAYPDSGIQDGYEYEYLGVPFDNAVTAPKIETGSYVGTGTYGADNPNTLTFGFVPKLVFIVAINNYATFGTSSIFYPYAMTSEYVKGMYAYGQLYNNSNQTAKLDGSIMYWYSSSAVAQLNVNNGKYKYIAIG